MVPVEHQFADRIRKLIPIASLEPWLQEQVFAQGEVVPYRRRATVFEEGDDDPYSFYLIDGEMELAAGDSTPLHLAASTGDALRALAQLRPRRYTARCITPVSMFRIKRAVLDHILSEEQVSRESGAIEVVAMEPEEAGEEDDWMARLLTSELFTRLPPDHMQRFFAELEPIEVAAGEAIVEQGTPGDFLYIVAEGQYSVIRQLPGGTHEQQLAILYPGDVFGEEALISELPRNATVRSLGGGLLMRLDKPNFDELVSRVTLKPLTYSEACELVAEGAQWMDVRFPEEAEAVAFDGAINVPLNQLRGRVADLDHDRTYVTYCDSGGRSSTAAFLLTRFHFDAYYLAGGLMHTPLGGGLSGTMESMEAPLVLREAREAAQAVVPVMRPTAPPTPVPAAPAVSDLAEPAAAQMPSAPVPPPEPAAPEVAQASAALQARMSALQAELDTSLAQLEAERSRHEQALAKLRSELRALKADRDQIAGKAEKAVKVARELKAQFDEARSVVRAERSRAAAAAKETGAQRVEFERRLEMERTRLQARIDAVEGRFKALGHEHQGLRDRAETERRALDEALEAAAAELRAADERNAALEAEHAHAIASADARAAALQEELEGTTAKVFVLEAEASTARSRIEVLEARFEATRQTIQAQETQLQEATRQALEREEAELDSLRAERADLAESLEALRKERRETQAWREEAETAIATQREALEKGAEALAAEEASLSERLAELEEDLEAKRSAFAAEQSERRAQLTEMEAELTEEKAAWTQRVDDAVAGERERVAQASEALAIAAAELESARGKFDAECAEREKDLEVERQSGTERAERLRAAELALEEQRQALATDLERREQALDRAQAALEMERASLDEMADEQEQVLAARIRESVERLTEERIEAVRLDYERRLAEHAALMADQRRQLESETLRLREALAGRARAVARRPVPAAAVGERAPPPAIVQQATRTQTAGRPQPSEDLPADRKALDTAPERDPPAASAEAPEESIIVPELDDGPAPAPPERSVQGPGKVAVSARGAGAPRKRDPTPEQRERARVINPQQLAEIRRKMQEKMAAVRAAK